MLFPARARRHGGAECPARSPAGAVFRWSGDHRAGVAAVGCQAARRSSNPKRAREQNPLQLFDALRMAALFQLVLMAVHLANRMWGDAGVLTTAALLGLTDVDALTMSMARGISGVPRSRSLPARLQSASPPIPR